ncbi:hypothetical protein [Amphibacillus indicireducens]|uniref:hypothetical protein n=1 Tax=Amphibacillus indicireducens TaxID=1076330 RepID=UPI0031E929A5
MNQLIRFIFVLILFLVAVILNLFGLMRIAPILLTLPLLFISIYLLLNFFLHRNTFRGFK